MSAEPLLHIGLQLVIKRHLSVLELKNLLSKLESQQLELRLELGTDQLQPLLVLPHLCIDETLQSTLHERQRVPLLLRTVLQLGKDLTKLSHKLPLKRAAVVELRYARLEPTR